MINPIQKDIELIQKASKGNPEAFTELFNQHFQSVYNHAFSLCGDPSEAEDLTQDTFIRAHSNLHRLGPPWNFRAWMFRITHNLFIDLIRREPVIGSLEEEFIQPSTGPYPEKETMVNELATKIRSSLQALLPNYREILILREVYGLPYSEIATIMDITHTNVKVLLHRARTKFQEVYGVRLLLEESTEDCVEMESLIHLMHDREITPSQEFAIREHLKHCSTCQDRRRWLVTQSGILASLVPVVPPSGVAERILENTGLTKQVRDIRRFRMFRRFLIGTSIAGAVGIIMWVGYSSFGGQTALTSQEGEPSGTSQAAALESATPTFIFSSTLESNFISPTPPAISILPSQSSTPTATFSPVPPTFTPSPTPDTIIPAVFDINVTPNPALTTSPITISARVTDPSEVTTVMLYYRTGKTTYTLAGPMKAGGGSVYTLDIETLTPAGTYDFRILATDTLGNATCGVKNLVNCPGGTFIVSIP